MPQRFRTKIVEVEATQFTGSNFTELFEWTGGNFLPSTDLWSEQFSARVYDVLHATWIGVIRGQWIVRGAKGEFYPCDDETFHWKYEEVNEPGSFFEKLVTIGDTQCEPVGKYL